MSSWRRKVRQIGWLVPLLACGGAAAADEAGDYRQTIQPILAAKCFACHGALKQEAGLRLDAASLIRKGGDGGAAIVPGKAAQSLLIARVSAADPAERMPPAGEGEPLSAEQLAALRRWIDQGAAAPDEPIPADPRQHWAYRAPARPALPHVSGAAAPNDSPPSAIDALLAAEHAGRGLAPAPLAEKGVLARRLYVDLLGLPPTREELHAFLTDEAPDAYERLVDRLLASPQYAARWGRHWMDVWRYSDWTGFGNEIRYSQRHIWRWRDWIVESLAADRGYDQMILEMLAADELAPGDDAALRATGFLARNWYKFDRHAWLDDVVEHTGKAFLGATFKCARCHDHKYDPISQQEYYRLRTVFEPYDVRVDQTPGELNIEKDGLARVYDAKPDAQTWLFRRGDPKQADQEHPLAPGVPAVFGGELAIEPVPLPLASTYPALRDFVARDLLAQARSAVAAAQAEPASGDELAAKKVAAAQARLAALEARLTAERARHGAAAAADPAPTNDQLAQAAAKAERLAALADAEEKRLAASLELAKAQQAAGTGSDDKARAAVDAAEKKLAAADQALATARQAAEQASSSYQPLGPLYPATSTGRRLALARWIVDRRHPLTARVAVNHLWLRHFGQPLVDHVDDFGLRSPQPPLADLLDWLAVELMESGWSMKHVHRQIVQSAAYRRSSTLGREDSPSAAADPDNRLFWRQNPRRLEAEAVRDAVLHVAGGLDLALGGPDLDPRQGLTLPRRSLFFRHARERQMEFLQMFDAANPQECYRRLESIRPQQAFALVNSSLALAQSRALARRLAENRADAEFIAAAFATVLARPPTAEEQAACQEFLDLQTRQLASPAGLNKLGSAADPAPPSVDPRQRARENLALVLLNHNDFVTIR